MRIVEAPEFPQKGHCYVTEASCPYIFKVLITRTQLSAQSVKKDTVKAQAGGDRSVAAHLNESPKT
jgi:hypothetical protein